MAANLNFLAAGFTISGGSGLGFFSSSFGNSVRVGNYNQTTYITDGNGVNQGPQVNNIQWFNAGSGYLQSATQATGVKFFPNYLASLNIRFTNDTAVKTQNAIFYVTDRTLNTANPASGVITQVYEIIHPDTIQNNTGSGTTSWTIMSGVVGGLNSLSFGSSPGISGQYNLGGTSSVRPDTQHDWYAAISASPITVGSKANYSAFFSVEYL